MKYELTTIADIFEKVPADRIPLCLAELSTLLTTQKHLLECVKIAAEVTGDQAAVESLKLKMPIIWADDGKGELHTSYCTPDGEQAFATKITREPEA